MVRKLAVLLLFLPPLFTGPRFVPASLQVADENEKSEFSEERVRYDLSLVTDPVTGIVPVGIREAEQRFALQTPARSNAAFRTSGSNNYTAAGPVNTGGRTRAVAYDVRYNGTTNRVLVAGSVSGGIVRSADGGQSWQSVAPDIQVHSFSALAQDPRPGFQDRWFAGGGEPYGSSTTALSGDLYLGHGLLRSTDNGQTWGKVPAGNVTDMNGNALPEGSLEALDHPFDNVHRIVVNPANGHVYVAAYNAVLRSTDEGNSFQVIFKPAGTATQRAGQTDVAVAGSNVLIAVNGGNPDAAARGIWVSTTGNAGSWQRIAGGSTPGVDAVDGWRGNTVNAVDPFNTYGKRILLAVAPSNPNLVYVIYQNGVQAVVPEIDFYVLTISGNSFSWVNRTGILPGAQNPTSGTILRTQLGYDMFIAASPANPAYVFLGGVQLYRAPLNFPTTSFSSVSMNHVDFHGMAFNPVNSEEALVVNDGGIYRGTNVTSLPNFLPLPNYQTVQYYQVSIDPEAGRNNFCGGAQDNGLLFRDGSGIFSTNPADTNRHVRLNFNDGAATGIARRNGSAQLVYGAWQGGNLLRFQTPSGINTLIRPDGLTAAPGGGSFGEFITNFELDQDNTEDLYYVNFNRLFRTTTASTCTSASGWTELAGVGQAVAPTNPTGNQSIYIRGMALSRGPYLSTHSLYFGTNNGRIFRLDDPRNAAPTAVPVNITPAGLAGNVQDIAVNPNDDNEVLAVVSNYNTVSLWWTANGKSSAPTWKPAEGNLTLPSVRSCAIVVKKDGSGNSVTEYYAGTSVGLFSMENLGAVLTAGGSPTWLREGGAVLNYPVVQSLAYRPSDNVLLVGTHGNGMYYTITGSPDFRPNSITAIQPVVNDPSFIKTVYPTLTAGRVQYQTGRNPAVRAVRVELFSMNGQKVLEKKTVYADGSVLLPSPGGYLLVITSSDGRYRHVQKIIRQ